MEQKERHDYIGFLFRELFHRIRREMFTLKGLAVLLFLAYMVFDIVLQDDAGRLHFMSAGIAGYWLLLLFPVALGKLFYMLPFDRQDQKRYITEYCIVSIFVLTVFVSAFGSLVAFLSGNLWIEWVLGVFLRAMPLWLVALALFLMGKNKYAVNNYGMLTTRRWISPENEEATQLDFAAVEYKKERNSNLSEEDQKEQRKCMILHIYLVIALIITMINSFLGSNFLSYVSPLAVGMTVLSYVLAVSSIITVLLGVYRDIDGSFTQKKGGEGCNS